MSLVIGVLLMIVSIAIALALLLFSLECLLGLIPPKISIPTRKSKSLVVIIPAHNEERGIGRTIESIRPQLRDQDQVLVVADNCSDKTADVALRSGARVVERNDPANIGKGFALAYAVDSLQEHRPEVLVIVDADCVVEDGGVQHLGDLAASTGQPVQGLNLVMSRPDASALECLSTFAFMVRNKLRLRALAHFDAPCGIKGSGFALPWLFSNYLKPTGHIVEDFALSLDLVLDDVSPIYTEGAAVNSGHVVGDLAMVAQRQRWESGTLSATKSNLFQLRKSMLLNPKQLVFTLDLLFPPLSLLLFVSVGQLVLTLIYGLATGHPEACYPLLLAFTFMFISLILVWWFAGRDLVRAHQMSGILKYVLVKLPIYIGTLLGKELSWNRSRRV